jgi:hypothetical protein
MMSEIREMIDTVVNTISKSFPELNIYVRDIREANEYFVLVDDKNIFATNEFLSLVTDINLNVLTPKGIDNIFIAVLAKNEAASDCCKKVFSAYASVVESRMAIDEIVTKVGALGNYAASNMQAKIKSANISSVSFAKGVNDLWLTSMAA